MASYPTKEEIESTIFTAPEEILQAVNEWKAENYSNNKWKTDKASQLKKLQHLVASLPLQYEVTARIGVVYCYQPDTQTIYLDKNRPSILSTLHEIGHHIRGTSELDACVWSVNVFKQCFPKAFQKLIWKGHMLIKQNGNTN